MMDTNTHTIQLRSRAEGGKTNRNLANLPRGVKLNVTFNMLASE